MADLSKRPDITAISVDFLFTDLDTAMTFAEVAEATGVEKTARRSRSKARRCYESVLRLLPNVALNAEQEKDIHHKLAALKARLEAVGEQF